MNITVLTAAVAPGAAVAQGAAVAPGATKGPGVAGLGDSQRRALPRARVLALPLIAVLKAMALKGRGP